jgi:preprotein translocase subunit YajC
MNSDFALALAGQAQGGTQQSGGQMEYFFMMIAILVIMFYFMILRPQKREQRRQDEMRNTVKKGDRVVTIGGVHGTVVAVDTSNNIVTVQVDKNVKIDFSKAAISTVIRKEDAREGEEQKKNGS